MTKKNNWIDKNQNKFKTRYRRQSQASPFFEFSSPAIAVSGTWIIDIGEDDPQAKKHLPLSNVRIVNNSSENIAFFPNQKKEAMNIPAGTIIAFDRLSLESLNSLKFSNLGTSSTNADEIKVTAWREGIEIDGAFQRMHKAFYERFLFPTRGNLV